MNGSAQDPACFALLGYGRFGAAFAELLTHAGHQVRAWDQHAQIPQALAAASLNDAVDAAQWIVLAMPVPQMRETLLTLRPLLKAGQIVFDVGSVKMHPCAAMDELLGDAIPHAGAHPLFGPLSLARGERPLRTVICASAQHPRAAERTRELFIQLGCDVVEQDPESHDRAMARTHVLAFFIGKGLIDIGVDDDMPIAPPSFQGMKHMLAAVRGDAGHLFGAIQHENPFAAEARGELLAALERLHYQLLAEMDDDPAIPSTPELPA
jgi:prephenate dehydrogenase